MPRSLPDHEANGAAIMESESAPEPEKPEIRDCYVAWFSIIRRIREVAEPGHEDVIKLSQSISGLERV